MLIGYFNTYKNMIGTIEYDTITKTHYGELINQKNKNIIPSYHAANIFQLENEFHNYVNRYLDYCEMNELEP